MPALARPGAAQWLFAVCLVVSLGVHVGSGPALPEALWLSRAPRTASVLKPSTTRPSKAVRRVQPKPKPRVALPRTPRQPAVPRVRLPKPTRRSASIAPTALYMEQVVVRELLPRQYKIGLKRRIRGTPQATPAQPDPVRRTVPTPAERIAPQEARSPSAVPVRTSPRGLRLGPPRMPKRRPASASPVKARAQIFRKLTRPGDEKRLGPAKTSELRYLEAVLQRIQAEMDRPEVVQALAGQKGIARASMELDHMGVLHGGVQIVQPGASPAFDREFAQAIRRASPFPQFPVYLPYLRARIRIEAYLRVPLPEDRGDWSR